MEVQPELSLGPTSPGFASAAKSGKSSSSSDSDSSSGKKRKHDLASWEEAVSHASLELQLNDPVPMDWEQCLDLHSGRMYYLNRKTMKKSWVRPKDQEQGALNLELNIWTIPSTFDSKAASPIAAADRDTKTDDGDMVAVPCVNCHLLVMLCKSSPSCPNCKFVQPSVPQTPRRRRLDAVKPLETLSLLH